MYVAISRLAGAALALVMAVGAACAADYRVVSFGDSLSDVGNLFDQTGNPPPPYFNGRFSNGPVWTEILAGGAMQKVSDGVVDNRKDANYAFGGASAGRGSPTPPVPDQIAAYRAAKGTFGKKDVVTMLAGANDLLALTATSTPEQAVAAGRRAAEAQASNLRGLIRLGARTIIVPTLPPLDKTPRGLANPALAKVLKTATTAFNVALKAKLKSAGKAHPGLDIAVFDLNGLFEETLANPSVFGLKNVTDPCLNVPACAGGSADVQNGYMFWDDIHPTAQVHRIVAFMARWDLEH